MEKLKKRILATNPQNISLIPSHLQSFARNMVSKWIENAVYAKYFCAQDGKYIVRSYGRNDEESSETYDDKEGGVEERCVVPVDFANTGVSMKNTIYSGGLHQFLQVSLTQ